MALRGNSIRQECLHAQRGWISNNDSLSPIICTTSSPAQPVFVLIKHSAASHWNAQIKMHWKHIWLMTDKARAALVSLSQKWKEKCQNSLDFYFASVYLPFTRESAAPGINSLDCKSLVCLSTFSVMNVQKEIGPVCCDSIFKAF